MPTVKELKKSGFTHAWMESGKLTLGACTACPQCGEPIEEANSIKLADSTSEFAARQAIADKQFIYLSPGPLQPAWADDGQVKDTCENCG